MELDGPLVAPIARPCPGRIEMAAVAGQPAERKVLVTAQGPAYEFIRTLKDCIYGKVKHVVAVDEAPGGGWVRREPLGQQQYALKIIRRDMLPGGAMHRRLAMALLLVRRAR